ncbi:hypothetical protein AVEN_149964-1 [Araneus ventricosus]|uniref:Uncharacterized protein n=1 Tax=Araneus ventricosus TaxID=182803 RepID=A0A4Y2WJM1_ARAVE|nr:hypothetical protein AVEN_149964-1 [Araneus ventricosus]
MECLIDPIKPSLFPQLLESGDMMDDELNQDSLRLRRRMRQAGALARLKRHEIFLSSDTSEKMSTVLFLPTDCSRQAHHSLISLARSGTL